MAAEPDHELLDGHGAPTPESASIDQTQANLTFYMVGYDPAGTGPLVIQGVFNPGSTPTQPTAPQSDIGIPQIQNATVASTTAYSVTWNNGLTFTNLTPQTSYRRASSNRWLLSIRHSSRRIMRTRPPGAGIAVSSAPCPPAYSTFGCMSIGGDSPGWIFAFAPGNGIPAARRNAGRPADYRRHQYVQHTTRTCGSRAGRAYGTQLHAIAETGETGWLAVDGNEYDPINTSATSIPASGVSCSTYGLPAGNDCYLIQINSHTVGSVTGYEPYFASPSAPFLGTPGELRTTQIGDTACVTTAPPGPAPGLTKPTS
jgi:hypothetical protein